MAVNTAEHKNQHKCQLTVPSYTQTEVNPDTLAVYLLPRWPRSSHHTTGILQDLCDREKKKNQSWSPSGMLQAVEMVPDFINRNQTQKTDCVAWIKETESEMAWQHNLCFPLSRSFVGYSGFAAADGRLHTGNCEGRFLESFVMRDLARLLRTKSEVAVSSISCGIINHSLKQWKLLPCSLNGQFKRGNYKSVYYPTTPFKWFLWWRIHYWIKWLFYFFAE